MQELLHQRGIQVSHETLHEWCIKFGPLFAEDLRHWEPFPVRECSLRPGTMDTECFDPADLVFSLAGLQ